MSAKLPDQMRILGQHVNQGRLSRREFLRAAILLGASVSASEILAACSPRLPGAGSAVPTFNTDIYHLDDDVPTMPPNPDWTKPAPTFTPRPEVEWTGRYVPTATPSGPYVPEWYCSVCGQHFMSLDMFLIHAADAHTWRLPEIKPVENPTYAQFIVQPLERFDERNTVFSRTDLDADYQARRNAAPLKNILHPEETLEGQALLAGAIYVDNKAGSLHENYYGYFGHIRGDKGLYDWD